MTNKDRCLKSDKAEGKMEEKRKNLSPIPDQNLSSGVTAVWLHTDDISPSTPHLLGSVNPSRQTVIGEWSSMKGFCIKPTQPLKRLMALKMLCSILASCLFAYAMWHTKMYASF